MRDNAESGALKIDPEAARKRLDEERARLQATLEAIESGGSGPEPEATGELSTADQHPADEGTETQYREQDLSMAESVRAELDDIDAALARLEDGTYGRCQACGRPIGADRLDVLPATRFCLEDAQLAEREARGDGVIPQSGAGG